MRKKINIRFIQTATLAIIVTLLLTVAVCYNVFKNQVLEDLKNYAGIVKITVLRGQGYFEKEEQEEITREHIRVTLLTEDGSVVWDTRADPQQMENHAQRPEVSAALQEGEGSAIRQSDTLKKSTYYYALKLENGQILRVAKEADSVWQIIGRAAPYLLLGFLVLFVLCCVFSHLISENLMKPVKLIAEDIDNAGKTEVYEELLPYIQAIKNQHEEVLKNALQRQEFTANVSHELKTPLTAISGYSELIEKGMVSKEEETRRFAGEIHKGANRLLTLINDVIRLSELDGEEAGELLEVVDLGEIAGICVDMLKINAKKHGCSISFEGGAAYIMATRQMAEEVLYNLCDNAIRYNRTNGTVQVRVWTEQEQVILSVKDTGIGIPKEHQERIFERFYRVDKGRSKSTGGTGLGLAIVKHIAMRLEAAIVLESREGEGTEMRVIFPEAEDI